MESGGGQGWRVVVSKGGEWWRNDWRLVKWWFRWGGGGEMERGELINNKEILIGGE